MQLVEPSEVLTVREASKVLRLGLNSTYAAIARGEIPARRVGRRWLVPRAELERFLRGTGSRKRAPGELPSESEILRI